MNQIRVEPRRKVIAGSFHDGGNARLKFVNERDHVDHRLGREPVNSGGANVVDLYAGQQRGQSLTLDDEEGRPRRLIFDDLDRSIAGAFECEIVSG